MSGHQGAKLTARAGAITITGPQALLVSNNAYDASDIAGLGHVTGHGSTPARSVWLR